MLSFLSQPLTDLELYSSHNMITYYMLIIWCVFILFGIIIKSKQNLIYITYFLIGLSIIQEILDYINRIFINDLYTVSLVQDLPLQLCHFTYWSSVICLIVSVSNKKYKFSNVLFNCSYIFGFAAFQGILTVDLTAIYTFGDMLALHLQHSLIVLNILWLIVVFDYKFSFRGIFESMIVVNILAFFIMIVNYFLGSNYMFLCIPPAVDNPLIVGDWPWYILSFEVLFLVFGFILLLPFKLFDYIQYNQN
ncbi:MAG: TIGR02206 family membrane protein [Candidatus Marinimicrobia bacterium]|nr:TIGR02206 family membrane protein [Candidatus Neomarinimicrobiota bacterium]|tara:strand:- start:1635 stop:2381 length:747 start_codon:yes stop_codon:yes gene_type:complete